MSEKFSKEFVELILTRLDRIAGALQESKTIDAGLQSSVVAALDKTADAIEITAFGRASFDARRAKVIQRDKDEPYMDTFNSPTAPIKTDKDEHYMNQFKDDQSVAVQMAKTTTGKPLVK